MANLLQLPALWNIVTNFGSTPALSYGAWTGTTWNFDTFSDRVMMCPIDVSMEGQQLAGIVNCSTGEGTPDDLAPLIIAIWPNGTDPNFIPNWDEFDPPHVIYSGVATEHTLDLEMPGGFEGRLLVIGQYRWPFYPDEHPSNIAGYVGPLTITFGSGPTPPSGGNYFVYEMEKGWSFDGYYIPHFLELNWYFGEAPISYHGIQKLRIHGLSKGWTQLQVAMAGMQTEYDSDYMQPQWIDLPKDNTHVRAEYRPVTNYTDYSVRGLSIQMLFSGRNEDLTKPEPSHVIQVLVTQSTPLDSGFRAN